MKRRARWGIPSEFCAAGNGERDRERRARSLSSLRGGRSSVAGTGRARAAGTGRAGARDGRARYGGGGLRTTSAALASGDNGDRRLTGKQRRNREEMETPSLSPSSAPRSVAPS
jgi:hypothetical protein